MKQSGFHGSCQPRLWKRCYVSPTPLASWHPCQSRAQWPRVQWHQKKHRQTQNNPQRIRHEHFLIRENQIVSIRLFESSTMQQIKANHPRWQKNDRNTKKNIKRQSKNSTVYSTSTSICKNMFATTDTRFTSPRDSREPPDWVSQHEVFLVTSTNPTLAQPGNSSNSRDRAAIGIGSIKSLCLGINVNSSPASVANPKNCCIL